MAQPGSAPALGAGGRRFKSARPDQRVTLHARQRRRQRAGVAQLVERQPSKLNVAGSIPVARSLAGRRWRW